MNQILITNNNCYQNKIPININTNKTKYNKKYFFIFLFSIIVSIVILFYLSFSYFFKIRRQKETNLLKDKYIVTTLYNTNNNYTAFKLSENISIIGLIDIPKLNISYPILSNSTEELLKISVCRFSGPFPNRIGNLCIAGHNYNNTLMFSKLNLLDIGDSIFITDLNNSRLEYIVYKKLKVDENNLDCTKNTNDVEVTLITCNDNNNSQRIVIKAKMKG